MILRWILVTGVAIAAYGSAACFEAVSKKDYASELVELALTYPSAERRLLQDAEELLSESWSRPLGWHAGAIEEQSWIAVLRAENGEVDQVRRAAQAAQTSVALSPIQPKAWLRLAVAASEGIATDCKTQQCLELSWRSGPMLDHEAACQRLQLAYRVGMIEDFDDWRFRSYARSATRAQAARCYSEFPPEPAFRLLLRHHSQY